MPGKNMRKARFEGPRTKDNEMQKLIKKFKTQMDMIPINVQKQVVKKEMGGEVMDTTKSMPVGMMDGGKVKPKKMNMGGVVPGRGGKFKGVR